MGSRRYYGPGRVPEGQVVFYGASWCEYCAALRRHLGDSRIPYVERDLDASKENLWRYMWAAGYQPDTRATGPEGGSPRR